MNNCTFMGVLIEPPELFVEESENEDINYIRCKLKITEKRRQSIINTIINLEMWDSGATAFMSLAQVGDEVLVECSARNDGDDVYFRVNNFKVCYGYN